jgi:glutaredoxin 3
VRKEVGELAVTIYTKPGCPYCAAAKDDLAKRGVDYREINAAASAEAKEELIRVSGGRAVPVIVENTKVTIGFGGS